MVLNIFFDIFWTKKMSCQKHIRVVPSWMRFARPGCGNSECAPDFPGKSPYPARQGAEGFAIMLRPPTSQLNNGMIKAKILLKAPGWKLPLLGKKNASKIQKNSSAKGTEKFDLFGTKGEIVHGRRFKCLMSWNRPKHTNTTSVAMTGIWPIKNVEPTISVGNHPLAHKKKLSPCILQPPHLEFAPIFFQIWASKFAIHLKLSWNFPKKDCKDSQAGSRPKSPRVFLPAMTVSEMEMGNKKITKRISWSHSTHTWSEPLWRLSRDSKTSAMLKRLSMLESIEFWKACDKNLQQRKQKACWKGHQWSLP